MKKILSILLLLFAHYMAFNQKQMFEDPSLKEIVVKHKLVAILPFKVSLTYQKVPRNYNSEGQKTEEELYGYNFQKELMTYLLKHSNDYIVHFQDIESTNILLKQANVYDKIDIILEDSLCKILKVDAIIKSHYYYEKTESEASQLFNKVMHGTSNRTGTGSIVLQIHNNSEGQMIWRYHKYISDMSSFNASILIERMMRKIGRNFPYSK